MNDIFNSYDSKKDEKKFKENEIAKIRKDEENNFTEIEKLGFELNRNMKELKTQLDKEIFWRKWIVFFLVILMIPVVIRIFSYIGIIGLLSSI